MIVFAPFVAMLAAAAVVARRDRQRRDFERHPYMRALDRLAP